MSNMKRKLSEFRKSCSSGVMEPRRQIKLFIWVLSGKEKTWWIDGNEEGVK